MGSLSGLSGAVMTVEGWKVSGVNCGEGDGLEWAQTVTVRHCRLGRGGIEAERGGICDHRWVCGKRGWTELGLLTRRALLWYLTAFLVSDTALST